MEGKGRERKWVGDGLSPKRERQGGGRKEEKGKWETRDEERKKTKGKIGERIKNKEIWGNKDK